MYPLPATGDGESIRPSPAAFTLSPTDDAGLMDRTPAVLYSAGFGPEGRWYFVSPQIELVLGYTPPEWCADPEMWRKRLHHEDAARVLAEEEEPNLDDEGDGYYEYRMLHRDGHVVWIRDDALLVRREDGGCAGTACSPSRSDTPSATTCSPPRRRG